MGLDPRSHRAENHLPTAGHHHLVRLENAPLEGIHLLLDVPSGYLTIHVSLKIGSRPQDDFRAMNLGTNSHGILHSAALWVALSPVRWDPTGLWSLRLREIDDILIILIHGKVSRFCNIHTRLSSRLFRSVLWLEYGCAIVLTATLPMRKWPIKDPLWYWLSTNTVVCISVQRTVNLVASLASLLISTVTWRHSKAGSRDTSVSFLCFPRIRIP